MASKKSGPIPLTEKQFANEVGKRLVASGAIDTFAKKATNGGLDEKDVQKLGTALVKAFKAETVDCITNGYKVTLSNLLRIEPRFVPEKPKGEMVRNPGTGETKPRAKAEPASFTVKAFASKALRNSFPSLRSKAGKDLVDLLAPKQKTKAAPAKKTGAKVKV
jgi:hypothetical protein